MRSCGGFKRVDRVGGSELDARHGCDGLGVRATHTGGHLEEADRAAKCGLLGSRSAPARG
jgi:hypothetical protein